MVNDWPSFTLGELCSLITDGKHGDCENQANSGFYFLSVKDVVGNRLVYDDARQITESDFLETHRRTNLEPGDVLFTNTGTIGRMAIAPNDPKTCRTTFQKSVAILKPKRETIDSRFLYYLLRFDNARLSEFGAGTTQKNLLLKDFRRFVVQVPSMQRQQAIAFVLGALDDKIELNRRMNRTLEQMAAAIFKAWFVDFEPVKAKAAGATSFPTMPQEVFDALSNEFTDSPLGPIPKGWEVGVLEDLLVLQRGFDLPKTQRTPGPYPVMAASGPNGTHHEYKVSGPGVTTGRSGVLGKVFLAQDDFWPLNTSLWVKEYRRSNPYHAYFVLQLIDFAAFNAGSAVPTLNRNHVHSLPMVIPPEGLPRSFTEVAEPLFHKKRTSNSESDTLAAIRDALLPKLLSGEIRVGAAEQMVEEVA